MNESRSRRHGSGSVTSYQLKSGKRYRFQIRVLIDPDRPEMGEKLIGKGGFSDFDEAFAALAIAKKQKRLGKPATGSKVPTLGEYAQEWLESLSTDELAASTIKGYTNIVKNHITPSLGKIRLDTLTALRISKHYKELRKNGRKDVNGAGKPLSLNSVNKVHIVLGAILETAVDSGLILQNPAKQKRTVKAPTTKKIQAQRPEITTWKNSELDAFLGWGRDVFEDELHPLWYTIAFTGMRRSEALALQWGDINFSSKQLSVRRALDVTQRNTTKGTKTDKPRVLELDDATLSVLKSYKSLRGSISLDFARPSATVFGNLDGESRSPNEVSRRWKLRVQKARVYLGDDNLPTITLKELRHTHATQLLELGVNPKVVQERLGHSTISTTMNIYSHVTPTIQRSAIELLTQQMRKK